jgi:hypothetical protein
MKARGSPDERSDIRGLPLRCSRISLRSCELHCVQKFLDEGAE